MKHITIHIDGACSNNGKANAVAGYGIVYNYGLDTQHTLSGLAVDSPSTNNVAELTAFIEAFKPLLSIEEQLEIVVYTDSMFLINGATNWIHTWKKNGYKTANKTEVANRDLWELIDLTMEHFKPTLVHVLGHSGNEGNELADSLAVNAVKQIKKVNVSNKASMAKKLLEELDSSVLADLKLIDALMDYLN